VESGLLSYGGDTDELTNPFEVRMDKYIDLNVPDDVIGIAALRRLREAGPTRHQLGVMLEGEEPTALGFHWHAIRQGGQVVGHMTNCVWSYRLKRNIGFAFISTGCQVGDEVEILKAGKSIGGVLKALPFI
jgi:aminomethyltransferase